MALGEAEIKSLHGNGSCCFRKHGQIYHFVSPLYQNKDADNFISFILLKQEQIGLQTNQTKAVWTSNAMT